MNSVYKLIVDLCWGRITDQGKEAKKAAKGKKAKAQDGKTLLTLSESGGKMEMAERGAHKTHGMDRLGFPLRVRLTDDGKLVKKDAFIFSNGKGQTKTMGDCATLAGSKSESTARTHVNAAWLVSVLTDGSEKQIRTLVPLLKSDYVRKLMAKVREVSVDDLKTTYQAQGATRFLLTYKRHDKLTEAERATLGIGRADDDTDSGEGEQTEAELTDLPTTRPAIIDPQAMAEAIETQDWTRLCILAGKAAMIADHDNLKRVPDQIRKAKAEAAKEWAVFHKLHRQYRKMSEQRAELAEHEATLAEIISAEKNAEAEAERADELAKLIADQRADGAS